MLSQPCAPYLRGKQADGLATDIVARVERRVETRLCGAWELSMAKRADIIRPTASLGSVASFFARCDTVMDPIASIPQGL